MAAFTGTNTTATLNGLFKEVYADKIENLIPDGVYLLDKIKFVSKNKETGNLYHQPVVLGLEHGVTFSSANEGAFNLNDAVPGQIKDAQVQGTELVLRAVIGYAQITRSIGGGHKAFESATKFLVANMIRSMARKLEVELFYGQTEYGLVSTAVTTVITITTAEWAPGIWVGAENMPIQIYDTTGTTQRGTGFTITAVDLDARTITVTPDAAAAGVVATDRIFHKGANGNEFAGVHKILENTGTLFNISASTYNLWKGNTYSAGSADLSFTKIQKAVARAVEKGLDSDVVVLVNPRTWAQLLTDQAALRMYDSSYKSSEAENGSQSIKFHGQNGAIEITPSIHVKEGFAYVLALEYWMRIGSTDITFKRPGRPDEFFKDLESSAGYELRAYTDQALFCEAPGKQILITGIVNS